MNIPRRLAGPLALAACAACAMPPLLRSKDPLTADEHVSLGAAYETQGERDAAARQYQAALRLRPGYAPAGIALGDLDFQAGELGPAERCFKAVLKSDPRDAAASNNLAMVYLSAHKDAAEAERLVKQALAQDGAPRPYLLDTLVRVYIEEGRLPQALAAFQDAIEAAPLGDSDFARQLESTRQALLAAAQKQR